MEHKQTEATILTTDEAQGIVEAVWAVMGNVDEGNDILHPGAFTKTFSERGNKVKVLDQHRTDSVMSALGVVKELRELGQAELPLEMRQRYPEATGGAWGKFQFLLDTPEGKGAFSRIKNGAIQEWSFGYDAVDKDFSTSEKDGKKVTVRNLRQCRLYEVSPVLWGMNSATMTTDAKAALEDDKEMTDRGPVKRMGDVLQGCIHKMFTTLCDEWYIQGYMNRDERIALSSLIGDALDILSSGMPEELAMRSLSQGMDYYYYMSRDVDIEEKAGRVLSARNAARVKAIMDELQQLMTDAGMFDTEDDDKSTGPQVSPDTSTPDAKGAGTPDNDDSTRLLHLIEIEQEKLKLLEV